MALLTQQCASPGLFGVSCMGSLPVHAASGAGAPSLADLFDCWSDEALLGGNRFTETNDSVFRQDFTAGGTAAGATATLVRKSQTSCMQQAQAWLAGAMGLR
jgi:hypothetical protein